jgi:hypothetical protein
MTAEQLAAEARWRDHPLDALALVRASITYDHEAEDVLLAHLDHPSTTSMLVTFARSWLLNWCGYRDGPTGEAVDAALDYLDDLTAIYSEERAA